jgi:translation initiation factor 2 subunit 1
MLYKKKNYPEENEVVICTVKKILPHGVFVILDEFEHKEGLIHISEISPGRVRNIRDFVKEGGKIVCKILKINIERNHIDLTLRRVTQSQRINKNTEYKQEQRSEKILDFVAKETKLSLQEVYNKVGNKLIETHGTLYGSFEQIRDNPSLLKDLNLDKKLETSILQLIKDRIKKKQVKILATISLTSHLSNGIIVIKEILSKLQTNGTKITYMGAPNYKLTLTADNYKDAEKQLAKIQSTATKELKNKGTFHIERNDK